MKTSEEQRAYNRAQHKKHREKRLVSMNLYREKNRETLNAAKRKRLRENEDARRIRREWQQKQSSEKKLWKNAKQRATRYGLPFTIQISDIVIPEICPIFGLKLEHALERSADNSPSLDRIIPVLGYVPENIRVISNRANRIKTDATLEELERIVLYLKNEC